jgi:hypothetical protein
MGYGQLLFEITRESAEYVIQIFTTERLVICGITNIKMKARQSQHN